jgi:hypothetical protein
MTRPYLTAESAARIIELAFAPLRCVAEPWDYGARIRFRVFNSSDEPALTVAELLKNQFSDASRLELFIEAGRCTLVDRGFYLDHWSFPKAC